MKSLDAFARQPRWIIWLCSSFAIALVGVVDYVTPWKFSLFMFYAFAIFGVAWSLGWRDSLLFAAGCLVISWIANLDTYPFRDLGGYVWSLANRSVAFLFVVACGSTVRSYREEARARVAAMERARELEQEIVRSGEAEQRRIGQDLHDGVCQSLAAINCATELLRSALEREKASHAADAERIQSMLRESIVEVRNLAHAIAPVRLTGDDLPDAIESLVMMTNQLRGTGVTFWTDADARVAGPDTAIHLYRIAQEALSNAMKHSAASHVGISLYRGKGVLTLLVEDDGCGLAKSPQREGGMGLHTMGYRANLIGAELSIEENADGGVSVKCVLPDTGSPAPVHDTPRAPFAAPAAEVVR